MSNQYGLPFWLSDSEVFYWDWVDQVLWEYKGFLDVIGLTRDFVGRWALRHVKTLWGESSYFSSSPLLLSFSHRLPHQRSPPATLLSVGILMLPLLVFPTLLILCMHTLHHFIFFLFSFFLAVLCSLCLHVYRGISLLLVVWLTTYSLITWF